jgi:MmyB-like transcription regulator ligand binding domain
MDQSITSRLCVRQAITTSPVRLKWRSSASVPGRRLIRGRSGAIRAAPALAQLKPEHPYRQMARASQNDLRPVPETSRPPAPSNLCQGLPRSRAGAVSEVGQLVDELCRLSSEFEALWRENDVDGVHGEGVEQLRHPVLGPIALEYSAFAVDGPPDLSMVGYNLATRADADLIRSLVTPQPAG